MKVWRGSVVTAVSILTKLDTGGVGQTRVSRDLPAGQPPHLGQQALKGSLGNGQSILYLQCVEPRKCLHWKQPGPWSALGAMNFSVNLDESCARNPLKIQNVFSCLDKIKVWGYAITTYLASDSDQYPAGGEWGLYFYYALFFFTFNWQNQPVVIQGQLKIWNGNKYF